jgi:hypothetical protein
MAEVDDNAANKSLRKLVQATIWVEARKEAWALSVGAIAMIASSSVNQGKKYAASTDRS